MSTHKRFDLICIVVIICALLVTVLFMNGEKLGIVPTVDEDSPYYTGPRYFSTRDQDSSWDSALATAVINMEGDTAQIDGNGAYTVDGNVYITANGVYVLSGKLDDGSIIIDAYTSS